MFWSLFTWLGLNTSLIKKVHECIIDPYLESDKSKAVIRGLR